MKRKEVMMSFGMVKCDGGVRQEQKTVIKEGEQMEEDGWSTDNIHQSFPMQIEDKPLKPNPQRKQN